MKSKRTWILPMSLLLAAATAGCGEKPQTEPASLPSRHSEGNSDSEQATTREAGTGEVETQLTLSFDRPRGVFLPHNEQLLYATIELTGKLIAETSAYGLLRIDSVKDDQGKSLQVRGAGSAMNDPTREFIKTGGSFRKKDNLTIHLRLQRPSDNATALMVLDGSVQVLTGGKHKELLVDGVLDKSGTILTDPALRAAGLDVKPRIPDKGERLFPSLPGSAVQDPEKTLVVEVSGRYKDSVEKVALLDGTGAEVKLSGPRWQAPSQQKTIYVFETEEPVPQDAKLRLKFSYGQVLITVPLKFTNVPIGGQEGKTLLQMPDNHGGIFAFAFSPDGTTVAGGTGAITDTRSAKVLAGGEVVLWNAQKGNLVKTFGGHGKTVTWLAFSQDGKTLASASQDNGLVRLWDMSSGKPRQTIKLPGSYLSKEGILLSQDGSVLVTVLEKEVELDTRAVTTPGELAVWDTTTGKAIWSVPDSNVRAMAFTPDGNTLAGFVQVITWRETGPGRASGSHGKSQLSLWNVQTGELGKQIELSPAFSPSQMAFLSTGDTLAGLSSIGLSIYHMPTSQVEKRIKWAPIRMASNVIAFSADGKTFGRAGSRWLELWNLDEGTIRQLFTRKSLGDSFRFGQGTAFSPDLKHIVCSQQDKPVIIDLAALKSDPSPQEP